MDVLKAILNNYWNTATPDQKDHLVETLRDLTNEDVSLLNGHYAELNTLEKASLGEFASNVRTVFSVNNTGEV